MSVQDELSGLVGQEIGVGEWVAITQEQVDLFAEATLDHQWIHVDPDARRNVRLVRQSPTAS